jgi:hypothetical protein
MPLLQRSYEQTGERRNFSLSRLPYDAINSTAENRTNDRNRITLMPLNVAVQMDPIERINIRGDSTFALLLEAQARGHSLFYYTPDQLVMRDGTVSASVQPLAVRDKAGDHYTLGEARVVELSSLDVVLLRQDPPFDLAYITSTQRSGPCAQRAGKGFCHRISRSDAADAGDARPGSDQEISRRAR